MELMVKAMKTKVGNPLRKLVLIKLADNANDKGECWPSYQNIADQCEVSRASVRNHIKALREAGLLRLENRKSTHDPRQNTSNLYTLTLSQGVVVDSTGVVGDSTPIAAPVTGGGVGDSTRTSHSFEPVNEPNTSPKKSSGKKPVKATNDDYLLANLILDGVRRLQPNFKTPNLDTWANDCRKIRELDNRAPEEIAHVFSWANRDDFWQTNILSPAKLRKQFDQLQIKANQCKGSANENRNSGAGNQLQQQHAQLNAAFARASAREANAGPLEANDPAVRPQMDFTAQAI
ncbi:helix-turn-helix domain-containing protein [Microbulbifer sp. VVAC002]|uniref:helix-turn-helix domain-containing protein n=1 Tax=Microbulbifer sp. VVAC002 TaxID=3243387 RepID=UPI004039E2E3